MLKLPGNLASLARLASKDATRYSLNAVRVRETTEGYQVVATDGRRMAIVSGPGAFDEPIPPLEEAPDDAIEALVPAAELGVAVLVGGLSGLAVSIPVAALVASVVAGPAVFTQLTP